MTKFLFSVDVESEDPAPGKSCLADVPQLAETYLSFLRSRGAKGTFFIVGEVARRHPDVVRAIILDGHEVGCHSDLHLPLHRLGPAAFRADTLRNLDALYEAGAVSVPGYRAPFFSLTMETAWAHQVLHELGFHYSSSVLPARSPLYGWPGFGRSPRRVAGGLWEVPISLFRPPLPPLPVAGGVYFRALPGPVLRLGLRAARSSVEPLIGYFHPYDIHCDEPVPPEKASLKTRSFTWLMRRNRHLVLERLQMVSDLGFAFGPIGAYVAQLRTSDLHV